MKGWDFLLILILSLQVCSVYSRYHSHHHRHHRPHHRTRTFQGRKAAAVVLPAPKATKTAKVAANSSEESEEARGLRGQANVLASLQKSIAKCTVEGSYGIHGECSKYTDCARAGLIPSFRYCPSGKFFDHLQRMCIKSSDAQCKDVCKEDGHMLADPTTPHGYLGCIKGVPMPHPCADEDQVFSFDKQACVDEKDADSSEEDEKAKASEEDDDE